MRLPLLSELDDEQLDVYAYPVDDPMLVIGPPGSGKTSMAIWRALLAARQDKGVVMVTRNRLLAAVAGRLAKEGEGGGFQAITMHKLVRRNYKKQFNQVLTEIDAEQVHDWPRILKRYKHAQVEPHIDHLMVDEAQNLPPGFFDWAEKHIAKSMSVFADEHQTIIFGGSKMADLGKLNIPDEGRFRLMYNHRNTDEIAKLSGWFHRGRQLPQALAKKGPSGNIPELVKIDDPNWGDLARRVADRLANVSGSIGVITYKQAHVEEIHRALTAVLPNKRVDSYHSRMDQGAEFFEIQKPGVTVLSGESAIGLEFDTVFLHDLKRSLPIETDMDANRLYMLTARARDLLVLLNGPTRLREAQLGSLPPAPLLHQR